MIWQLYNCFFRRAHLTLVSLDFRPSWLRTVTQDQIWLAKKELDSQSERVLLSILTKIARPGKSRHLYSNTLMKRELTSSGKKTKRLNSHKTTTRNPMIPLHWSSTLNRSLQPTWPRSLHRIYLKSWCQKLKRRPCPIQWYGIVLNLL